MSKILSCQQEIVKQLVQQSIQYDCVDQKIVIQVQKKMSLKMDLQQLEIFSNLIIQNIETVEIDLINIQSCLINLVSKQSSFIQINNIQLLAVGNIYIDQTQVYQENQLININNIDSIQINELTINTGYFVDPKDIKDKNSIQKTQISSQNQKNSSQNYYLIEIFGGKIDIEQLIMNTQYTSQTNICAETLLKINQIKINIQNLIVYQKFQVFSLQAGSLSQFFAGSIIIISTENLPQRQNYFLYTNLFASQQMEIEQLEITLPFTVDCFINVNIQSSFQDQSMLKSQDNQSLEINQIILNCQTEQISDELSFQISGIKNVQINEIKKGNTIFLFWNFNINLCQNVFVKRILLFSNNNNQIQLNGPMVFSQINNLVFEEINIENIIQSFSFNFIEIDNSKILINNIQITNFENIHQSIIQISQSPSVEINNFTIENSMILDAIIQFSQVKNIKMANFKFNSMVKKEGKNYFNSYKNPAYLIYVNETDLMAINNFYINFNNNQYGLLWAQSLRQIIIEETQLKNAFAINQGGCMYLSNTYDYLNQTLIALRNSYFYNFSSTYFGGCIYGGQITQIENTQFKYCSSYIGGALYVQKESIKTEIDKIMFEENKAQLYGDNFSFFIEEIMATQIYEYNPQFQSTNLYFYELSNPISFIKGMNYVIGIKFRINDEFYPKINQKVQSLNMYYYLKQFQNFQNDLELDINSPFLSFYLDAYYDFQLSLVRLLIADSSYDLRYNFTCFEKQQCPQTMEKVIVNQKQNIFLCKYCDQQQTIQIYQQADGEELSLCQSCNSQYFQVCYANYSQIKEGYWRNSYSIEKNEIFPCSISPQNCIGDNFIGY
ncbi:hypothetical protein ABPG74_007650 [Tetrahymena malaccensis]